MATVFVPTPLRRFTGGESKVTIDGGNIGTLLKAFDEAHPGVGERIFDDEGNVKRFINVFLNDDEIGSLQGLETPVGDNDRVSIVPAMAGGSGS